MKGQSAVDSTSCQFNVGKQFHSFRLLNCRSGRMTKWKQKDVTDRIEHGGNVASKKDAGSGRKVEKRSKRPQTPNRA